LHRPTLKRRDGPGSALVESTLAGGTLLAVLLGVNNLFMWREVSVAAGWLPSGPRTGPSLRPKARWPRARTHASPPDERTRGMLLCNGTDPSASPFGLSARTLNSLLLPLVWHPKSRRRGGRDEDTPTGKPRSGARCGIAC